MGPGEFLNVNFFTALFTLVNTVVLFLVLKKFLWGPVMKMIADRQQEIDDMYTNADKTKRDAEALQSQYREKLSVATQTGEQILKEAVERGHRREENIIRQANAEAEALVQKAKLDIAWEKKKAVNEAKNEIADLALDIAGKVVAGSLTGADRQQMVDRFIEELGEDL